MKKIGLICAVALAGMSLAACGNNKSKTTNDTASSAKVTESVNKFGQNVLLSKGDQKARMVIQSVKVVDPDDNLVTDISHNYKDTHQYVIVTYKVTAVSNKINLDAFDGSNLSLYDSKGQSSVPSSNRESVTPNQLHKGETQVMKMGFGLRAKSSKVTIHYGDETWKGKITDSSVPSTTSSFNSNSSSNLTTKSNSSAVSTSKQLSQQGSDNNKATVNGHTFHRENAYGTEVWVGDNNEGELGEWAVNDPSVMGNNNLKQQVIDLNNQ